MNHVSLVVVDAGARYGLHPTWADMRGIAEFHLFEMDEKEAERLSKKYQNDLGITVYPLALYSRDATLTFTRSEHRALNSVLETNDELLNRHDYKLRDFEAIEKVEVQARSLDSLFADKDVHFMKLDVEGAEQDVLEGARALLERSVMGLRAEVLFAEIYKGAALFGELNKFMLDSGFELLNLDYDGAGNKAGMFTLPNRFGRLLSSDAVWTVTHERLFDASGLELRDNVLRSAIFLMNNAATDVAIDLLILAVTKKGVDFGGLGDDILFRSLHVKCLKLFKALFGVPCMEEASITKAYATIFNRDFPLMNRFYESDLLS